MTKMNFKNVFIFSLVFFVYQSAFAIDLKTVSLNASDFLPLTVKLLAEGSRKNTSWAGWVTTPNTQTWADITEGFAQGWELPNGLAFFAKYGCFPDSNTAKFAAEQAIKHMYDFPMRHWETGTFSNTPIGDFAFKWDFTMEKNAGWANPLYPGDKVIISFCKGNYVALINMGKKDSPVDKTYIEKMAHKCETKIDVARSINSFETNLSGLINHHGTLRSLQAKLDVFTKHFQKGEYNTALNNINAFINELNAQRGKHVSESAYQTLKAYADTIVQSLNSLM